MSDTSSSTNLKNGEEAATPPRAVRIRRARPWHRVLGMLAVLPLVWVVLTGAVLNHTVDWKLDRIMIDHPWVLAAYGMAPEGEPVAADVDGWQVVEWDGLIFVNGETVPVTGQLVGALAGGDGLAVVTDSQVIRLHGTGEVLETMDEFSLPALPLTGVCDSEEGLLLRNNDGWHRVEKDWLEFVDVAVDPDPQLLKPLSSAKVGALRSKWAQGGLPLSRVLLDAHAGHFLGDFSKYFYDVVAIITVWLCVTGVILFFRQSRRAR